MVRRLAFLILICITLNPSVFAQRDFLPGEHLQLPLVGIKTNLLYDATGTIHLGGEIRLPRQYTIDLSVQLNPWNYSNDKRFKHLLVQPELRYWVYEPFNGHFFGGHLMWAHYNIGNIDLALKQLRGLRNNRYEGDLYGLGLSYGYHWLLTPRLSIEATFGFGYSYMDHSVYECGHCGAYRGKSHKHYIGPTKAGVSLIYFIK